MREIYRRSSLLFVFLCFLASPAAAQQESTIYTFPSYAGGFFPRGGLAIDSTGTLYGTTQYGGVFNGAPCGQLVPPCGTIYKLTPSGGGAYVYTLLHMLLPAPIQGFNEDGERPVAPLVAFNDVMYGVNSVAGATYSTL